MGNPLTNMESASYHVFSPIKGAQSIWTSVDAFDFSVEHISMYERVLESTSIPSSPIKAALLGAYGQRLTLLERDQRARCSEGPGAAAWHAGRSAEGRDLAQRTVAVMPFYAVGAGRGTRSATRSSSISTSRCTRSDATSMPWPSPYPTPSTAPTSSASPGSPSST